MADTKKDGPRTPTASDLDGKFDAALDAFGGTDFEQGEPSGTDVSTSRRSSRRSSRRKSRRSSRRSSRRKSRRHSSRPERGTKRNLKSKTKSKISLQLPGSGELTDLEGQKDDDSGKGSRCNVGMWVALTALIVVVVLGGVLFLFMGGDGLNITDDLLECFDIADEDRFNYDVWIAALKEKIDEDNYCMELIQACKAAAELLARAKDTEKDFSVKMSRIYHVYTHVYFFAYTGDKGISKKKVGDKKMGKRLMELFEEWHEYCPDVKTPWKYKKFILTHAKFADFAVSGRAAMIEDAEVMLQEGTVDYNFFPPYGTLDWSKTDWKE